MTDNNQNLKNPANAPKTGQQENKKPEVAQKDIKNPEPAKTAGGAR